MTSPKIFIIPSDAGLNVDPTVSKQLLDYLPNRVGSQGAADVVIVPVSWHNGFRFNEALRGINKRYVLLDHLEYGWSWPDGQDNLLGRGNLAKCGFLNTPEYAKLDEFVGSHPPALTLKRELYLRDASDKVKPIEWLVYLPSKPLQTREQFNARPIEIFSNWGLSHPMRQELHGSIFTNAHKNNIFVADGFSQEQRIEGRCWFTVFSPWYARTSMENILRVQRRSKISVSLFGAGSKCFRSAEALIDAICAMPYDNLAWAYPYQDNFNCIRIRKEHLFDDLNELSQRPNLYEIYCEGQKLAENYRSENYIKNYVVKEIEKAI